MTCASVDDWYICESREMEIVDSIPGDKRHFFNFKFCYCSDPRDNYKISWSPGIQHRIFISGVSRLYHCCTLPQHEQRNGRLKICVDAKTQKGSAIWNINDRVTIQDIGGSKGFRGICALRVPFSSYYYYYYLYTGLEETTAFETSDRKQFLHIYHIVSDNNEQTMIRKLSSTTKLTNKVKDYIGE